MIEELALATNEKPPAEVYLIPDVNAWVAQRGGIWGIGSRRVMALGLPLMQVLSINQLRSVLEFGHYYGGDTRLGPVVYNLRGAIQRTVSNPARRRSNLQFLFTWYGEGALKLTQNVSRQQELAADELAAHLVGAKALSEALQTIHTAGFLFVLYLHSELTPVLCEGVRPPFAAGFSKFLAAPAFHQAANAVMEDELAQGKSDPYDSHPPLRERLSALAALAYDHASPQDASAISLLRDLDALEAKLLVQMTGNPEVPTWNSVAWETVGEKVYLPSWMQAVSENASALHGVRPTDFPRISKDLMAFGKRIKPPKGWLPADEEWGHLAVQSIGPAFAVHLHQRGWILPSSPGEPVQLLRGPVCVRPFTVLGDLKSGALTAENWERLCSEANIMELDMGTLLRPSISRRETPF